MLNVLEEALGPALTKWHLNHPDLPTPEFPPNFRPALHLIAADNGTPHDHSWDADIYVALGGYEEEVFWPLDDGRWYRELVQRKAGQARHLPAETVHRIVRTLGDGPCVTFIVHHPLRRDWRYFPEALNAVDWRPTFGAASGPGAYVT